MKFKRTYDGIFDVAKPYTTSTNRSKIIDKICATKILVLSDAEGFKRAYDLPNKVYVYNNTNKMYIAGTSSWQDVWADFKIPVHQTVKDMKKPKKL